MSGAFWQRVLDSQMAVPEDRPLPELTAELVTMLGSSDPLERDGTALPVLTTWLSEGVYDDLLVSFGDSIADGLRVGLGEQGTDTVFRRSLSARVLETCIRRDNDAHLVPVDAIMSWAESALGWFTRERDVRGWVPGRGWAHAVANGADVVAALAASRHLEAGHLAVLLDVVAERLTQPTDRVWTDGEDDRLAYAVAAVLQRNLVESPLLEHWLDSLADSATRLRTDTGDAPAPPQVRNTCNFLRALYAHLSIGISPADPVTSFREPPAARSDVLLALLAAIPRLTPWLYAGRASRRDG